MSVSRFLTIDLQRGDIAKANETFNTALFGTLIVILLLVPVALGIAWVTPYFFSIGEQSTITVFILFSLVFLSAFIRAWSSNFMVTLFAHNRLDLWNWVNASYLVVQVVIVVILFLICEPSLPSIGISYLIAAVFSGVLAVFYSRKTNSDLKVKPTLFNKYDFREMGKLSGWILFQQFGTLLKLPIALIIVNILFGELAETQYSIAMTFIPLLIGISGLITGMFRPMIYSYVANNDNEGAARFISFAVRITGLSMALPLALVCLFAHQLLTIWVGEEYSLLAPLVWILVLPTIFLMLGGCTGPLNIACNRVKVTAIANFIAAIINVGLALSLPYVFDIGIYGVAIAWAISTLLYDGLFGPMYNAYIIKTELLKFIKSLIPGIIALLIIFVSGIVVTSIISIESFIIVIILSCAISVIYCLIVSKYILRKDEIMHIRSCIPEIIDKKIPKWLFR